MIGDAVFVGSRVLSSTTSVAFCRTRNLFMAIRIEYLTPHVTRAIASNWAIADWNGRPFHHSRACRAKPRSGRSPPHEVAEAFHRTVNCCIRMRPARAGADGAGRRQRHRHSAGDGVARPVAFAPPQHYSRAAHMRVLGKGREHFVLRIRSSLRVTGFVLADYIDPHRFHEFRRPGRFSTPPMFAGIKDTALSSVEARAKPRSAWGFRPLNQVVAG
jgi:hypothetical protein